MYPNSNTLPCTYKPDEIGCGVVHKLFTEAPGNFKGHLDLCISNMIRNLLTPLLSSMPVFFKL